MDMESRNEKSQNNGGGGGGGEVAKRCRVPYDLIHFDILPRLSFKSLSRFKNVCKAWHDLISNDPFFALEQSRGTSPTSSGFAYLGRRGLEFLSSPNTPVGVPDPSLSFLGSHHIRLVASTNGLLCFYVFALYFNFLCVLNPATQEYGPIPQSRRCRYGVGLAFDPSTSPTHYALVYPKRDHVAGAVDEVVEYRFKVFSSCTGKWVQSAQKVIVSGFRWRHQTPALFCGGVLYWDCVEYLIWFDPCKDLAGWMLLPAAVSGRARHAIGSSSEGQVTCTVILEDTVEVFVMKDGNAGCSCGEESWSRRYRVSLEGMVEKNRQVFAEFCNTMRLRNRSLSERLLSRWFIQPLAFEGGDKLYLWVRARNGKRGKERVLCHDLGKGEVTLISNNVSFAPGEDRIFAYRNTMARFPNWAN
ncbi:F-box protein At5g49610-like [Elaeis guineensis]|uniref:F-box protein At5g49610-like n=1 Tax=Elaeis guineensis var. tenera TaxID=51953 RepID=UPI003C6CD98A